ncbi:MAG: ATP-dependent zinc protease family protein [Akkermansiaceae bacterium]
MAQVAAPVSPPLDTEPAVEGIEEPKPEKKEPVKELKKKKVEPEKKAAKIYGWKEWVWAVKPDLVLRAKLDTGARTSSIHATNIEQIEIDGEKWVKFTISNPSDEKSIRLRHKAPLIRISKVKNDSGGIDERFVVHLTFQIGTQKIDGEFNLNNREKMTCPMLIGRNILMQLGLVDAGRTDLLEKPKKLSPTKKDPKTEPKQDTQKEQKKDEPKKELEKKAA